jgi:hypothetical protein
LRVTTRRVCCHLGRTHQCWMSCREGGWRPEQRSLWWATPLTSLQASAQRRAGWPLHPAPLHPALC